MHCIKWIQKSVPIYDQKIAGHANVRQGGQVFVLRTRGSSGLFKYKSYFESKNEGSERIYGLIEIGLMTSCDMSHMGTSESYNDWNEKVKWGQTGVKSLVNQSLSWSIIISMGYRF